MIDKYLVIDVIVKVKLIVGKSVKNANLRFLRPQNDTLFGFCKKN